MNKDSKIYVAGHNGMVGSAIMRKLTDSGYTNIITRSSSELDLTNQLDVHSFFSNEKPEYVFIAAAVVGGIHANSTHPADFIYHNIMIQTNIIHASHLYNVTKLLLLGSSCIYPKMAEQPITEDSLLSGHLEPTNEAYAIAKIAGVRMCAFYRQQHGSDFISVMPTNLFGVNDNFNLEYAHVLPSLMHRFHLAKLNNDPYVTVWGTGEVYREFQHTDELADALLFIMDNYSDEQHINCGSGDEISIKELAEKIKAVVGYEGSLIWDRDKPDGTPRKLMDSSKLNELGWKPSVTIDDTLKSTYEWFVKNFDLGTIKS